MNIFYIFIFIFFHLSIPTEWAVHVPYFLSPSIVQEVQHFLMKSSYKDSTLLLKTLQKQFRWIISATVKQLSAERYSITLTMSSPFCAFNSTEYVAYNGSILPCALLREDTYAQLPVVHYPENTIFSDVDLGKQIASLPPDLFNSYTITWYEKNKIILIDKNTQCFPIITSLEKKITTQIAHYCHYIHKKITETYTKKKKKKYALDVRFDKQIVLRPQEDITNEQNRTS